MAWRSGAYPSNWRELVAAVRERSGDRCEALLSDGQRCSLPNSAEIHRMSDQEISAVCGGRDCPICPVVRHGARAHPRPGEPPVWLEVRTVVLTTAHLCQDSACADLEHLRHLCQLHHLRYDAQQHARNAAATRRRRRVAAGQGEMGL